MKNLFKIITSGFLVAGSLSVITSSIMAQELPSRGPIPFSIYDVNNDGQISTKEFYDVREKRTEEKVAAGMPMKNAENTPTFGFFDLDGDGKLSETELIKGQNMQMMKNRGNQGMNNKGMGRGYNMPSFESFDLNHDGVISDEEMEEAREKRMEDNSAQGKMMRNIGNQPIFSDIDTNKDGNISKEEFQSHQMKQR
ncbi:EF-hand domain-containing protein [Arcobacter sp.]|uniref:EF-hand domain-containing protein n=1 Tax=unclassified Arcobacter TaxID=2593671 RepID=UPI003B00C787|eukprot:TRINITY_DN213_c1_g2_i1.p1 TRINITY_DN213_c1_g2~~TRINITY_DN213_c1_g2_i1.p1  ORF type:complete len:196 (-),score=7.54 TRINITY_DN213_c1_g2_i1:557-1144(-)